MSNPVWWDRPHPLRWILLPLSGLYALGWGLYRLTYTLGFKQSKRLHNPVICVGNYRVGGTGKTPFVRWLTWRLQQIGHQVVLSTSGYGSPRSDAATLAPEGPLSAMEWGDEAALLRLALPDVPIIVGRRRTLAAQICHEKFPAAVMLMDDGFQHLPLAKDITIVLDPPGGNQLCLPSGPYRENRLFRGRASLVLPSSGFNLVREPMYLLEREQVKHGFALDLLILTIAQPENFVEQAKLAGFSWQRAIILPDHAPVTEGHLEGATKGFGLCTTKDWVKIKELPNAGNYRWVVADYDHSVHEGEEFLAWLINELGKTEGATSKA